MNFVKLRKWENGQWRADVFVNFDYVAKIQSGVWSPEIQTYFDGIYSDPVGMITACEEDIDYEVTEITMTDGETILVFGSARDIMDELRYKTINPKTDDI